MNSVHADCIGKENFALLEQLIDKHGIHAVTDCIADICLTKAEHIRANWQDQSTAKLWGTRAAMFTALWAKLVRDTNPRSIASHRNHQTS